MCIVVWLFRTYVVGGVRETVRFSINFKLFQLNFGWISRDVSKNVASVHQDCVYQKDNLFPTFLSETKSTRRLF